MLRWKYAQKKEERQATVLVSAECFCGDAGGPLVAVDYPRHDAAGISQLQGIPGILRRNRDEYIGGPATEVRNLWSDCAGARSVGWTEGDLPADGERNRPCAGDVGDGAVGGGV